MVATVLAVMALAPPAAGQSTTLDLVLPVQDLTLATASLDGSIASAESERHVEVTLDADVLFGFDRASLTASAHDRLRQVAGRVRTADPPRVHVDGYTDARGPSAYNLGLSHRRAAAVAAGLREQLGGAAPAFRIRGHGEAGAIAPNRRPDGSDDPQGRRRNRRVTVSFAR